MATSPNTITVKIKPDMVSAMDSVKEIIKDTLFRYSEWLDSEGLVRGRNDTHGDDRSHDDLVQEFLAAK